mmetsp:Transcript_440/g.697  ORF Transcript_440/g.697 Transcript_440/m.697 type:complete len:221 (-) Transcript_440:401-1063(-)
MGVMSPSASSNSSRPVLTLGIVSRYCCCCCCCCRDDDDGGASVSASSSNGGGGRLILYSTPSILTLISLLSLDAFDTLDMFMPPTPTFWFNTGKSLFEEALDILEMLDTSTELMEVLTAADDAKEIDAADALEVLTGSPANGCGFNFVFVFECTSVMSNLRAVLAPSDDPDLDPDAATTTTSPLPSSKSSSRSSSSKFSSCILPMLKLESNSELEYTLSP